MIREHAINGKLPSGYRKLEYIETTGTQYVDTGLPNIEKYSCALDYKSNGGFGVVVGSWDYWQARVYYLRLMSYTSGTISYGDSGAGEMGWGINASERHTYRTYFEGNMMKTDIDDSTELSITLSTPPNQNRNLWIFANNSTASLDYTKGRLYECVFENLEGKFLRYFIPALRLSDNKPGLYDLCKSICPLTGTPFYINAGSGEFLYE